MLDEQSYRCIHERRMRAVLTAAALVLCVLTGKQLFFVSVVEASSRSVDSTYDTSKGVFSPQGRLVQMDYIEGIVKRGNLCIGAECKDGVVLVTNKLMTADAAKLVGDGGGVRRIYRVDSHVAILPAGLPADGRALAQKAMEYCRSHRREYAEPIPGRVLAERMGDFLHAAVVRWGSRAYPNTLFIACWEEGGEDEEEEGGDSGGIIKEQDVVGDGRGQLSDKSGIDLSLSRTEDKEEEAGLQQHNSQEAADVRDKEDTLTSLESTNGIGALEPTAVVKAAGIAAEGENAVEVGNDSASIGRHGKFALYVVEPNGATRRYKAACTGRGSTRMRKWLHRRSSLPVREGGSFTSGGSSAGTTGGEGGAWVVQKGTTGRRLRTGDDDEDDSESQEIEGDRRTTAEPERVQGAGGGTGARPRRRLLTDMTCAELSRALVRAASRSSEKGGGQGGGREGRDVVGIPEVAWLAMGGAGRGSEVSPELVHDLSPEALLSEEEES